jgi:uncharacterized cupredoxin-like copper-binding protein
MDRSAGRWLSRCDLLTCFQDLFDKIPANLNWNVTGWLVYDETKALPEAALVDELDAFDDWTLVPYDNKTILAAPDQTISLDVVMNNLDDGANYAFFNNITYKSPVVPTLYTALTSGPDAANPAVYGEYTHSFVLAKGEIVEIIVNNLDTGKHPFHLHGHEFQAVWRSAEDAGPFQDSNVTEADLPAIPMRRDTFVVRPGGNIVLRFQANNPGVWLFHCHIEWHVASGLMATMVEAPLELQKSLTLPQDHLDVCAAGRVPVAGNAAGNTANLLDLSGQNAPPGPLPAGYVPNPPHPGSQGPIVQTYHQRLTVARDAPHMQVHGPRHRRPRLQLPERHPGHRRRGVVRLRRGEAGNVRPRAASHRRGSGRRPFGGRGRACRRKCSGSGFEDRGRRGGHGRVGWWCSSTGGVDVQACIYIRRWYDGRSMKNYGGPSGVAIEGNNSSPNDGIGALAKHGRSVYRA